MTKDDRRMTQPLRVGVIGLGRRWQRQYRPALSALRRLYEVRVLCDQMQQQALREARRLGCDAVTGVTTLLESDDVDAVLVLDAQWFRLWPVEQACRFGKPVLCGESLERDDAGADALLLQVRDRQLPVMVDMRPRLAPALVRLRELLAAELGPPRLVVCESRSADAAPWAGAGGSDAPLLGPAGLGLVDACTSLFGGEPAGVQADQLPGGDFGGVLLDYGGGRAAHVVHYRAPGLRPGVRVQVVTDGGGALARLPNQVRWSAEDGHFLHTLPGRRSLTQVLLERFYESVRTGGPPAPSLEDAHRALRILRAAAAARAGREPAASG